MSDLNLFDSYLQRWSAQAEGKPLVTHTSKLLPVKLTGKREGLLAMIKITKELDECIGERYYDYVNVLCNPDLKVCTDPMRFARQLAVVIDVAGLERGRLLKWVMACAALSAAWFLEDGLRTQASRQLAVAYLAQQTLAGFERMPI